MGWVVNTTLRPLYPREIDPVPILQEADFVPGTVWNIPSGLDLRTFQAVVSHYTAWATLVTLYSVSHSQPNPTWTRHFFNNFTTNEDIRRTTDTLQTHTTDTFLFNSHRTNVPLFKFRCSIFIGVRIIKEKPGWVASGTHCIIVSSDYFGTLRVHKTLLT
jgi:hypothetical protein